MDKEHCCLNCKIQLDRYGCCEVCRWEDANNPSVFYSITRSPETLVEHLVYYDGESQGWTSKISDLYFDTKEEAIRVALRELNQPSKKEDSK